MRVALAQVCSTPDPQENLALVRDYATRAADAGARLVVFPEATMATFARRSAEVAEPLDGPFARGVRVIAAELGVTLVVGMFTPARSGGGADSPVAGRRRVRNTLLVAGGVEASYDKLHLFDAWGFTESRHIEPGEEPCRIELDGVRMGLTTCYDVRFPELYKFHAEQGADLILVAASWAGGEGKLEQWRALCVARALDSTCYIVASAQADPATLGRTVRPGSPTGVGHSVVVSPLGEVLAEAGAAPELLVLDLDPAAVADARGRLPVLASTRFTILPPGRTPA